MKCIADRPVALLLLVLLGRSAWAADGPRKFYSISRSNRDDFAARIRSALHTPHTVKRIADAGLDGDAIRVANLGGSKEIYFGEERLRKLGRAIAKRRWTSLSGGGTGVPYVIQRAAFDEGGYTVGVAQSSSLNDHEDSGRPTDQLRTLVTTATGRGPGTIEREAALIQAGQIRTFSGGDIGTLGELVASLYEPGVIAVLRDTGGIADKATTKILPHLGPLPANVRIVEDRDPEKLLQLAQEQLNKLSLPRGLPKDLVEVGLQPITALDWKHTKDRNVVAFLVGEHGLSQQDEGRVAHLAERVMAERMNSKAPLIVVPASDPRTLSSRIVDAAAEGDIPTVEISHKKASKREQTTGGRTKVFLGKGEGVGEFASQREVVNDAQAVFVAGGDYKTLAGVIFALHKNSVIGVLKTGGVSGQLEDILSGLRKDARVIYDSDPDKLFTKVKEELEPKHYSYDHYGSEFPFLPRRHHDEDSYFGD
jgi:hypothetical protein